MMNAHPLAHLLWILPLALLAAYVGSPRFLGTIGKSRVRRVLRSALDRRRHTIFDDLTLPSGGGTIRFDIVVVSRAGVFVIDAIHRRGRLSGTRVQPRWVERRWARTRRFDNPVHENFLKVQALERLLSLPQSRFHGLVAVSGKDRVDPGLPDNVLSVRGVLARIRGESRQLLDADQADRVVRCLRQSAVQPSWQESGRGWKWLRASLVVLLIAGAGTVYRPELTGLAEKIQRQAELGMAPERFHPDGRPKTERELWEERLVCGYSVDSGRCACYEPNGERAEIETSRCRDLAERGSILHR